MGTNYYAGWNPMQGGYGPVRMNFPQATVHMHICKSLTSFQGSVFNSWSAWRNFLTQNRDQITITDEYGNTHDHDEFVSKVDDTKRESRSRQFEWVQRNSQVDGSSEWMDSEGFSFYAGEFS